MTEHICKNCNHAGSPHDFGDQQVVECRIDAVTISGFPITREDARCGRGEWDDEVGPDSPEVDPSNYISAKQDDGTIITLCIPDAITMLYFRVKELEQEIEYLKRQG